MYRTIEDKKHVKDSSGNKISSITGDHDVNIYCVVIDANYPYNIKHLKGGSSGDGSPNKFICALKVVDSSMYSQKELEKCSRLSYATIVVVGERLEDMPVIRRIGDIIRIQKASMKIKEGIKQFVVDERSCWCLFGPNSMGPDDKTKIAQVQYEDMDLDGENHEKELSIKRSYMPYKYSGKNFSFFENEEFILQGIRKW